MLAETRSLIWLRLSGHASDPFALRCMQALGVVPEDEAN